MDKKKFHIVAVTAVIEKDGKFLIIKRKEDEIAFPGMWTVPGGKVEAPDDCEITLYREIEEEVGVKVGGEFIFLNDYEFTRPDGYHVIGLTFGCRYKSGRVKLGDDFTDFAWVTLGEAKNYDLIPGLYEELEKAKKRLL